jgi:hypothetical protein
MFDLKTNREEGRLPREEFEYQRRCESGASEEQIVRHVFFARVQSNGRQQPFFGPLGLNQKRRVDS